ncbi:MAG: SUF system Fe-S cluster assembly protein [Bacteroidia bacterium]
MVIINKEAIIAQIRTVFDPEIPVNIYDLGLIYDVLVQEEGKVTVVMTLTAPACPAAEELPAEVKQKVEGVSGVESVAIDLTFDPPWSQDLMSEEAKLELGML